MIPARWFENEIVFRPEMSGLSAKTHSAQKFPLFDKEFWRREVSGKTRDGELMAASGSELSSMPEL
jgi:hypothetical protein